MASAYEELKAKLEDWAETLQITGMVAKDELAKMMSDAQSNLAAAQENYRIMAEEQEGKLNSSLLEMQMNMEASKKAYENEKLEKKIEKLKKYVENCRTMATWLIEEANTAELEAEKLASELEEKAEDTEEAEKAEEAK